MNDGRTKAGTRPDVPYEGPNLGQRSAMKKQKHKVKRNNGPKAPHQPAAELAQTADGAQNTATRRDFLRKMGNRALIVAVVGGAGWYLIEEVRATIREEDLSRIGNGIPAVVQIHDPQCPRCAALQRETRDAMAEFDDGELQYLVANIRSAKGRQLAGAHGVGHITLLLFDGEGKRREVLVGANTSENLAHVFRAHVARSGS